MAAIDCAHLRPAMAVGVPAHPCRAGKSTTISVQYVCRPYIAFILCSCINVLDVTHRYCTTLPAGVGYSLFPTALPKWWCADLRSLLAATNLVAWRLTPLGCFPGP